MKAKDALKAGITAMVWTADNYPTTSLWLSKQALKVSLTIRIPTKERGAAQTLYDKISEVISPEHIHVIADNPQMPQQIIYIYYVISE